MTIQADKFKNKISYVYPIYDKSSFNVVSSNHIKYLRNISRDIQIQEIDWSKLVDITSKKDINVLLHPILYPFGSPSQFGQNSRNFSRLLDVKHKIGGFDVADSDKISPFSVEILNKLDLIMVPSNWAKDAYINSGVKSPVEILPHGIPDEFLDSNTTITSTNGQLKLSKDIINLRKRKEEGNILILYFMMHSSYRKGTDLVTDVMKRIQNKFKNVQLVFKSPGVLGRECPGVNGIMFRDWMDINDMKLLYDTCDICICPSRGGGFELNALEAVSRGVPTLAPNGGCFLDYIDYLIPINLNNKKFQLFVGNPIHIGNGFEVDIDDFEAKLIEVINNIEEYKTRFRKNSTYIRDKLSWRNTAKILEGYLRKYEFID